MMHLGASLNWAHDMGLARSPEHVIRSRKNGGRERTFTKIVDITTKWKPEVMCTSAGCTYSKNRGHLTLHDHAVAANPSEL